MNENLSKSSETHPITTAPVTSIKYNLICASKCKKFALEVAKANRATPFSRVGSEFLIACEANLKQFIHSRVKSHPSKGKTLQ